VHRERRHAIDRRRILDRRDAATASAPFLTAGEPAEPAARRMCRKCGSSSLDRSRRGRMERIVTWFLNRNAFRCGRCGWRGWLRADP
jgi:hypothetical protein